MKLFQRTSPDVAVKAMDIVHTHFFTREQRRGNSNQRKSESENSEVLRLKL